MVTSRQQSSSQADAFAQASFMAACLAWQESLLQAYRNYLLVTQSIFLAVAVGLLTAQASNLAPNGKLVFGLPFVTIAAIGISTLIYLSSAIRERARAVDWWQRRLLRHERSFPTDRSFTTYRIAKEHGFNSPSVEAHRLDDSEIERLLRLETPRARKVFGIFVPGFAVLWGVLLLCAGVDYLLSPKTTNQPTAVAPAPKAN